MAAIWPSTNGGVRPPSSSRALSFPCHSAAASSYGSTGNDRRTTPWRYSSRAVRRLPAGSRLEPYTSSCQTGAAIAQWALCCSSFFTTLRFGSFATGAEIMVVSRRNLSVTDGPDVLALDLERSRRSQLRARYPLARSDRRTCGMRLQSWNAPSEGPRTSAAKAQPPLVGPVGSAVRPYRLLRRPESPADAPVRQRPNSFSTCLQCTSICTSGKGGARSAAQPRVAGGRRTRSFDREEAR